MPRRTLHENLELARTLIGHVVVSRPGENGTPRINGDTHLLPFGYGVRDDNVYLKTWVRSRLGRQEWRLASGPLNAWWMSDYSFMRLDELRAREGQRRTQEYRTMNPAITYTGVWMGGPLAG